MTAIRRPLVLFGSGEIAEIAAYYFRRDTDREISAFVVDDERVDAERIFDAPLIGVSELPTAFPASDYEAFVAVGYSGMNLLRQEKCAMLSELGYGLASYVAPTIPNADDIKHGHNCFILEDNTIQPFVRLGDGVTLWSGNHIGHHSAVGDFTFVSSHVVVSGGVTVGQRCFLGVNATLADHIEIGDRVFVGPGALISKSAEDESVFPGTPAEKSRVPSSRLRGF